jgi:hypothetical protein
MWAEKKRKRPHEWLEGVLGVLGLAPSTHISQINQKVIKGYIMKKYNFLNHISLNLLFILLQFIYFGPVTNFQLFQER